MKKVYYYIDVRKKPFLTKMVRWNGKNKDKVLNFLGEFGEYKPISKDMFFKVKDPIRPPFLTREFVPLGWYIVKNKNGSFSCYDYDDFHKTYEIVDKDEII